MKWGSLVLITDYNAQSLPLSYSNELVRTVLISWMCIDTDTLLEYVEHCAVTAVINICDLIGCPTYRNIWDLLQGRGIVRNSQTEMLLSLSLVSEFENFSLKTLYVWNFIYQVLFYVPSCENSTVSEIYWCAELVDCNDTSLFDPQCLKNGNCVVPVYVWCALMYADVHMH